MATDLAMVSVEPYGFVLHALYGATWACYICYNTIVKFRFRAHYNQKYEHFFAVSMFNFSVFLMGVSFIYFVEKINSPFYSDGIEILNIVLIIALLVIAKILSNYVDHLPSMIHIVKYKEPYNYSLIRQFCAHFPLIMIPIVNISVLQENDVAYLNLYTIFATSMLIMEGWERIIPVSLSFKNYRAGLISQIRRAENSPDISSFRVSESRRLKETLELAKQSIFWFREISGSVVKSSVNCWACFVILILASEVFEPASYKYENIPYFSIAEVCENKKASIQLINKSCNFDQDAPISTSFYMASSEMFFGNSGIFPSSARAKVVYFFMHLYGTFLYGVFFAFGLQAFYEFTKDRGEKSGTGSGEESARVVESQKSSQVPKTGESEQQAAISPAQVPVDRNV